MRRVETAPLLPARDYAYYHQVLDGVRLPAAFVDLDALTANLQQLGKRAGRLPVRLVTKSIRSVEMMRMIMSAAPFVQGLLCYSAAEAAWLDCLPSNVIGVLTFSGLSRRSAFFSSQSSQSRVPRTSAINASVLHLPTSCITRSMIMERSAKIVCLSLASSARRARVDICE